MTEVHAGMCGTHQSSLKLQYQLKSLGYYWPTMVVDCIEYAKRCLVCQLHSDYGHVPTELLHTTSCSRLFFKWRMDIVGPITPTSAKGHQYIRTATDYFSKWAEAVALREIKSSDIVWFVNVHLIYRFRVPNRIITDNGNHSWVHLHVDSWQSTIFTWNILQDTIPKLMV